MSTAESTPTIWLDVDGVLNAVTDPTDLALGYQVYAYGEAIIVARPAVIDRIRTLATRTRIVLHTAWTPRSAVHLLHMLDLPGVTVSEHTDDTGPGHLTG